ncbi:hypothetical protein GJ699_06090 [Duganella sp. FT80W]|uniref:Uncharacterized protein n=1 Tax=Duganella guangzhouensis TaxID=2666084 RepID=A0A6I2KZU9_9BURK|nr:hypothetical protein [Duganella guangzhouensis]MRW89549.1 hypothetical protein [Duganella guangzhouensis]
MANNSDGFWHAFSQAYLALQNEMEYFEKLAKNSIIESDKVRFFRAALSMEDLLAQMKSANQADIDAFNKTALKGPDDQTLQEAQDLATAFAKSITTTAKAESIVSLAAKFLAAWSKFGSASPA